MDILSINVDELEFDCTPERFQDEIVHPETGETLRQDFGQSGPKIVCQHPELFLHEFSQGGGYNYALDKHPNAAPPSTSFVLFVGDMRVAFDVTEEEKFAEDGITRLWEITHIGHLCSVVCFSPFSSMKGVDREAVTIARSMKFNSKEEQDQIVAIIVKALSSYNHKRKGKALKISDGKALSIQERKESVELFMRDKDEYYKIYTRESWLEKVGSAEVVLTSHLISSLEKGSYIA